MARTKHSTEASERILSRLREALGREPVSAVKFSQVRKALAWAVSDAAAGTKLPPVRDIAAASGVAMAPTQRAVLELVSEGTLRSAPRSGLFVAAAAPRPPERPDFSRRRDRLVFGTDSGWDFQLDFWRGLARGFEALHPNLTVEFKPGPEPWADPECDVYERAEWLEPREETHEDLLDASALLGEPCGGVLYHRTYYMLFNQPLLRRLGLPEPSYRTYASQLEYLEAVGRAAPAPAAFNQPFTLLGRELQTFLEVIRAPGAELPEPALEAWRQVVKMLRLSQYLPRWDSNLFLDEVHPLRLTNGVEHWWQLAHPPPFEWGAYPQLRADGSLALWPRVGLVPRRSRRPLEAARFLAYLRGCGPSFAAAGDIPVRPEPFAIPRLAADPEWFRSLADQAKPLRLADPADRYLAGAALNEEFWPLTRDHTADPDAAARRAVRLGRAYLASCRNAVSSS